jgi:hypothetical protein
MNRRISASIGSARASTRLPAQQPRRRVRSTSVMREEEKNVGAWSCARNVDLAQGNRTCARQPNLRKATELAQDNRPCARHWGCSCSCRWCVVVSSSACPCLPSCRLLTQRSSAAPMSVGGVTLLVFCPLFVNVSYFYLSQNRLPEVLK